MSTGAVLVAAAWDACKVLGVSLEACEFLESWLRHLVAACDLAKGVGMFWWVIVQFLRFRWSLRIQPPGVVTYLPTLTPHPQSMYQPSFRSFN
jgi:hypothetical protein